MQSARFLFFVVLLVVCAVLVVAFGAASSVAAPGEYQKASCAFNLMQLGKAIRMFANDHGGYICELSGRVERQVFASQGRTDMRANLPMAPVAVAALTAAVSPAAFGAQVCITCPATEG